MKRKINIVADKNIPFLKGVLEPYCNIEYYDYTQITRANIKEADCLIVRTRTRCNKTLLEGTKVKLITTATSGFDHIDIDFCEKNNIVWSNAPGCNSSSVMQYVASGIAYLVSKYKIKLSSTTIGIVGYGHVGKKVARLCKTLGMKTLINDPPLQRQGFLKNGHSIDEIIKNSDIITFHVPLNLDGVDKTYKFVNADFLSQIKDETIIINTSRGEIIEENVFKYYITQKKIRAIIDVWTNEPNIDEELFWKAELGTPHIAGYSIDGKANATAMCIQAISKFFDLPLKNWFPQNFPEPANKVINFYENLFHFIYHTYNIENDYKNLKESLSNFEQLRKNYPLRFEFQNYQVEGENISKVNRNKLKKLGFQII